MKFYVKRSELRSNVSYNYYDEEDNIIYKVLYSDDVTGAIIQDSENNKIGEIKERMIEAMPKYDIFIGDEFSGYIQKLFTLFKAKYEVHLDKWKVEGNLSRLDIDLSSESSPEVKVYHDDDITSDKLHISIRKKKNLLNAVMLISAIELANKVVENN